MFVAPRDYYTILQRTMTNIQFPQMAELGIHLKPACFWN